MIEKIAGFEEAFAKAKRRQRNNIVSRITNRRWRKRNMLKRKMLSRSEMIKDERRKQRRK